MISNSDILTVKDLTDLVEQYLILENRINIIRPFIKEDRISTILDFRKLKNELNKIEPEFLRIHETLYNLIRGIK